MFTELVTRTNEYKYEKYISKLSIKNIIYTYILEKLIYGINFTVQLLYTMYFSIFTFLCNFIFCLIYQY